MMTQPAKPPVTELETGDAVAPIAPAAPPVDTAAAGLWVARVLAVMVVILVLVNLPVNIYGRGLAHLLPARSGMVVQEGMLLQGSDANSLYLLDNHQLRRISSPEAYQAYQHYWRRPTRVDDDFLAQFDQGEPVRRWVSCPNSPYVYALENDHKRQCVAGCTARNFVSGRVGPWDRVDTVICSRLEKLPDGPPLAQ